MSQEIDRLVQDLQQQGFGYIPVDAQLIANAKDAARLFIDSFNHIYSGMALTRPGEHGPDVGIISKMDKDIKTYLHLAHDMPVLLGNKPFSPQQRECLSVMNTCRYQLETIGADVAARLDRQFGGTNFSSRVRKASRTSVPYSVSTLRFLSYPDVKEQKGASPHFDRSFITMHLGDTGGNLLIENKQGHWEQASPPQGSALVFFGVKVLELTGGKLKPSNHKSTTVRGKERTAAVMFVQADNGYLVPSAEAEYRRFYAK